MSRERMRPHEPLVDAARALLTHAERALHDVLPNARRGDPDAVHDARARLRRVRTEIEALAPIVFRRRAAHRAERRLRQLERALARSRDDDVLLASVQAHQKARPDEREDLKSLVSLLEHRRRNDRVRRRDALDKRRCREARAALRELGRRARHRPSDLRERVRDVVPELVWRSLDEVLAFDPHTGDPETLHRLRSSCRRLRFTLEMFERALVRPATLTRTLVVAQDELGALHDHHVAITRIERWLARGELDTSRGLDAYIATRRAAALRIVRQRKWLSVFAPDFRQAIERALPRLGSVAHRRTGRT